MLSWLTGHGGPRQQPGGSAAFEGHAAVSWRVVGVQDGPKAGEAATTVYLNLTKLIVSVYLPPEVINTAACEAGCVS